MRESTALKGALPAGDGPSAWSDDAHLVRAAKANPAEFAALYQRYFPPVYRYLRVRSGDDGEAADLTQDVFLKAFDALPRYRERGVPFGAWLFRIARNRVVDAHRHRRPTLDWDFLPEALQPSDGGDPEAIALQNERLARLGGIISELDVEKRELLALRYAAGLTAREIASVVHKSEAAVKKQFSRTLRSLKEQYDER